MVLCKTSSTTPGGVDRFPGPGSGEGVRVRIEGSDGFDLS